MGRSRTDVRLLSLAGRLSAHPHRHVPRRHQKPAPGRCSAREMGFGLCLREPRFTVQDIVFHQNGEHLTNLWPSSQEPSRPVPCRSFSDLACGLWGAISRWERLPEWMRVSQVWLGSFFQEMGRSSCTNQPVPPALLYQSWADAMQDHMLGCSPCGLEERSLAASAAHAGDATGMRSCLELSYQQDVS